MADSIPVIAPSHAATPTHAAAPALLAALCVGALLGGCTVRSKHVAHPPPTVPVVSVIGSSVKGAPLTAYRFGDLPEPVLIFAGIHGDESSSVVVARELVTLLKERRYLYESRSLVVLPVANPDGYAAGTRLNAHRIDLNRNFPASNWRPPSAGNHFGGTEVISEPETAALIRLVEELHPSRIVSIHAIERGRHGNNYDGPALTLAQRMSAANGYPTLATIGYPTPGSFGSWAGIDHGFPVITLELPKEASGAECWVENREALIAFITGDEVVSAR